MKNEISMVIGSWGSYNACNERALGSEWLDFSDYNDWEEIEEELENEGFILNGIDEELFIQDIEGIPTSSYNWDYASPKRIFELIKESEVLEDESKYIKFEAYLEVNSLRDFFELIDCNGSDWDQDIYLTECDDWDDYGRYLMEISGYKLPEELEWYFDYAQYGENKANDYDVHMTTHGVLEIL